MSKREVWNRKDQKSTDDMLREAGRRFLHGTMSFILAASLVPVPSQLAWAESSATTSAGDDLTSDETPQPAETPQQPAEPTQSNGPATTTDDDEEPTTPETSGSEDPETPTGDNNNGDSNDSETNSGDPEAGGNNGGTGADQSRPTGGGNGGSGADQSGPTGSGNEDSGQGGSGSGSTDTGGTTDAGTEESDDGDQDPEENNDADPVQDAEPKQLSKAEVAIVEPAKGAENKKVTVGEGEDATTYYAKGTQVKFTLEGAEGDNAVFGGLKITGNYTDAKGVKQSFDTADAESIKDKFVFDEVAKTLTINVSGTFSKFNISGVKSSDDKEYSDREVPLGNPLIVVADAPVIKTVKVGDKEIDLEQLSPENVQYLKKEKLVISVSSVLGAPLDKDKCTAEVSLPAALDDSKVVSSVVKSEATFTVESDDLTNGKLGFTLTIQDELGNKLEKSYGANRSLIIDGVKPTLDDENVKISSKKLVANGSLDGQGVVVAYKDEDHFDDEESKVTLTKDSTETKVIKWKDATPAGDNSIYVPFDGAGIYTIDIHLADKAGNVTDATYSKVEVIQSAPAIMMLSTDVNDLGESNRSTNDFAQPLYSGLKTGEGEGATKSMTLTVTISGTKLTIDNQNKVSLHVKKASEAESTQNEATWTKNTEQNVFTQAVTLTEAGTYEVWIEGTVEDEQIDPNCKWTVVVDDAAPEVLSLTVTGGSPQTIGTEPNTKTYYTKNDENNRVTAEIVIVDKHFNGGADGSKVTIKDSTGKELQSSGGVYEITGWEDGEGGKHTCTVTFLKDGDYTVTAIAGKDLAGNEPEEAKKSQTEAISIDTKAPEFVPVKVSDDSDDISEDSPFKVSNPAGQVYKTSGENGYNVYRNVPAVFDAESGTAVPETRYVTVTVQVDEAHFKADEGGTQVAVTGKTVTGDDVQPASEDPNNLKPGDYLLDWTESDNIHTCTVTFYTSGKYNVTATLGQDNAGNKATGDNSKKTITIGIDNDVPQVNPTDANENKGIEVTSGTEGTTAATAGVYTKEDGKNVQATVRVYEPHAPSDMSKLATVKVGDQDVDDSSFDAAGAGVTVDVWAQAKGDDGKDLPGWYTRVVTFDKDGKYTISVTPGVDALGNEAPAGTEPVALDVEVDTSAPLVKPATDSENPGIEVTGYDKDPTHSTQGEDAGGKSFTVYRRPPAPSVADDPTEVTATVRVYEAHPKLDAGGKAEDLATITVKDAAGTLLEDVTGVLSGTWEAEVGESGQQTGWYTRTVTLADDGTYTIEVYSGMDAIGNRNPAENRDPDATLIVAVDNSGPVFKKEKDEDPIIKLTGFDETPEHKVEIQDGVHVYRNAANGKVTAAVLIDEAHFDSKKVNINVNRTLPDGSTSSKADDYNVVWVDSGTDKNIHLAQITFNGDGIYTVSVNPGSDQLDNQLPAMTETVTFGIDNSGPQAQLIINGAQSQENNTVYSKPDDKDVSVQITLDEWHPKPDANGNFADIEINGKSVEGVQWEGPVGTKRTATINFPNDGTYIIKVNINDDELGNAANPRQILETIVVDNSAPVVTLDWEEDQAPEVKETYGNLHYLSNKPILSVTITDANIDEKNTIVNGTTIAEIRAGQSKDDCITYQIVNESTNNENEKTIVITASYDESRFGTSYSLPRVIAKDLAAHTTDSTGTYGWEKLFSRSGNVQGFVVDTTDPLVPVGFITNNPIDSESGYYFFKGNDNHIHLKLTEEHGIRFVGISRSDGTGTPYDKVISASEAEKYRDANSSQYDIDLTQLIEAQSFDGNIGITVTDHASHSVTWTINKTGKVIRQKNATGNALEPDKQGMLVLILDNVAPVVKITQPEKNANTFDRYSQNYFNNNVNISVTVADQNLPVIRKIRGDSATFLTVNKATDHYLRELTLPENKTEGAWSQTFSEGAWELDATFTDMTGNKGSDTYTFTVDTIKPVIKLDYSGDAVESKSDNGMRYYRKADKGAQGPTRTATITLTDANFNPEDTDLYTINVQPSNCISGVAARISEAWLSSGNGVYTRTIEFYDDAQYDITIDAMDKAGNKADIVTDSFVVDNTDPEITTNYAEIGGWQTLGSESTRYFAHAIQVTTTIRDRNFDPQGITITDDTGQKLAFEAAGWQKGDEVNGVTTYTQTMTIHASNGDRWTPQVNVTDRAGNSSSIASQKVIIDTMAPSIQVSVDRQPTSTGAGNQEGDPIQFFNQATTMTFHIEDIHGIRGIALVDPDGEYSVDSGRSTVYEGASSGDLFIALRDGTQSRNSTEFDRPIYLTVTDIAGNRRNWTIDRQGNILQEGVEKPDGNNSINNANIYPVALVQDLTHPVVALSGVTAGQYYNNPQTVHATVNEFNFDYLKRFDGGRAILHVVKYAGNAGRAMSTWEVPAASFSGGRPDYFFDQVFGDDGHYTISASFKDYANNDSNVAQIGEFTIDRTAPTITVTWDNNEAENGNHYRAGRTATITIVEHNFNAADFPIVAAGGAIGGWTHNGDTHTCIVTFSEDGSYTLNVSGKDLAGNQATPYSESEFVIDTTMPSVSFKGNVERYGAEVAQKLENEYNGDITEDGASPEGRSGDEVGTEREEVLQDHHAYNGEVSPVIVFRDDNSADGTSNYDASAVEYTVTDGGGHDVTSMFDSLLTKSEINGEGDGQEFHFGNLGLLTNDDGTPIEDPNAKAAGYTRYVYDPQFDNVYTIHATMTDLAGNQAENDITFSVNRYGSTYAVQVFDASSNEQMSTKQGIDGLNYHIVASAPRIEVSEINVSGSENSEDHHVSKEYTTTAPKEIQQMTDSEAEAAAKDDARPAGFSLEEVTGNDAAAEVKDHGWSEYRYVIREGNFGMKSDSDNNDGGQGDYRVTVFSVDRASNDTGTDNYLDTAEFDASKGTGMQGEQEIIDAARRNATVTFRLDEIGPAIEDVNLPSLLAVGQTYEASFFVNDVITEGDTVTITVDGHTLTEGEYTAPDSPDGTGEYRFNIDTNYVPFALHEVQIEVTDAREGYSGHDVATQSGGKFLVTILVPEIAVVLAVVGGITGGIIVVRKKRGIQEPDQPGTYE